MTVGVDESGKLDLDNPVEYVRARWRTHKAARAVEERRWLIYLAMLNGRQHLYYDAVQGKLKSAARYSRSTPRRRVRTVRNHMLRFYLGVLARKTMHRPVPIVNAQTFSIEDQSAAFLGRMLCLNWMQSADLYIKDVQAWGWATALGTAYMKTYWNESAGPSDGNGGVSGDVAFEVLNPFQVVFYPDGLEFAHEAEGAVEGRMRGAEEVERLYGIRPKANQGSGLDIGVATGAEGYLGGWSPTRGVAAPSDRAVLVLELSELPSPTFPQGLHVIIAGDTPVVGPEPYPYPRLAEHRELNYSQYLFRYLPGSPLSRGLLADLAQPQMDYNKCRSQEIEFRERVAGGGKIHVATGSGLSARNYGDDDGVVVWTPVGSDGHPPFVLKLPTWDQAISNTALDALRDMEDIASHHEVSSGQVPRNIESGVAIEALQERDDLPLNPGANLSSKFGLSRALKHGLTLAAEYYTVSRTLSITGPDKMPFYYQGFTGADVAGATDVWVDVTGPMPHSRAAQSEKILRLAEQGVLADPEEVKELLNIGMPEPTFRVKDMNRMRAAWENDRMARFNGAPQVNDFDDDAGHVAEHNSYRVVPWFDTLPAEVKQTFDVHITRHRQRIQEAEQAQMERLAVLPKAGPARRSLSVGGRMRP